MTRQAPEIPSSMAQAALFYARRGWPVFPCREGDEDVVIKGEKVTLKAKQPYTTHGLKDATTDAAQVKRWWKKWPEAMIGLPMGPAPGGCGCFALDFDPRTDAESGEVFTLERLKAELEAQIGGELPTSLAVVTPSDGVHVYLAQPDGAPIRNRGNLPRHVDVRGQGGYVIAPPSIIHPGTPQERRYRFLRGKWDAEVEQAPARLVEVLRAPKAAKAKPSESSTAPARPLPADFGDAEREAVRKYALAALDGECQAVRTSPSGSRNPQLNESALKIASLVAAGALQETFARQCLEAAARDNPGRDSDRQLLATIDSGWSAGTNNPRDLSEIAAAARDRALRQGPGRRSGPSGPRPPPAGAPAPFGGQQGQNSQPFRTGRLERDPMVPEGSGEAPALDEAAEERLKRISAAWLDRRLEHAERTKEKLTQLAFSIGRRISAGLIEEGTAKEAIWPLCDDVADLQHADIDRAIDDGIARGFDPGPLLADLACAMHPMTDFGAAERFRDRYGTEFRFTTGKGWFGWDQRRWRLLDQDKDTPPAELISAVFETIRSIQREARRVAETGIRLELVTKGKQQALNFDDPFPHAIDHWVLVGKQWKRFSVMLAGWGRQCEQAGKPAAIAALARRWLTVPFETFDCEQMAINVVNGTLRFAVETMGDGTRKVSVQRDLHRREDMITRLTTVEYDREAPCPLYDAMFAWAQPDPKMRRYVHQVGGYGATGDTGEHKLWYNWGRGRNGKSTTIDSWCSALGDYSATIGIESFLDQGLKKRGDAATPDLAKLGGIRMLRASEPDREAKLNSALVKAVTGGEPMSVRALHRGFFDLMPRFKLLASGNSKPKIPDTDEGIWARMKLVPWLRHIEKPDEDPYRDRFPVEAGAWPKKDLHLLDRIKAAELPGVFRRLVEGLVDYLEHGFVEPEDVTVATAAYRDQSDPLARFLRLCTERAEKERVKSSELHAVFCAWCKAAGEREWTNKGFSDALQEKGYTKTRSDGMRWEGLRLTRTVADFTDADGKVLDTLPDLDAPAAGPVASARSSPTPNDDFIPGFDED